ncbi:MAG: hypothetical protein Q9167_004197 [Letrouitia subvulpina]
MLLTITILLSILLPLAHTASSSPTDPPIYTTHLHHLSPKPAPLATLSFSPQFPHLSRLLSFTPPPNSTSNPDAITSVGICFSPHPPSDSSEKSNPNTPAHNHNHPSSRCRTTATATRGFYPPAKGRFRLMVDAEGQVLGASWHSWVPTEKAKAAAHTETQAQAKLKGVKEGEERYEEGGKGDFDLVLVKDAPRPHAGDGAAGGKGRTQGIAREGEEGEEEEVVERTFLQK